MEATKEATKPKPMSETTRRRMLRQMVGDLELNGVTALSAAVADGDYYISTGTSSVLAEDKKAVKREAKAILQSFRAWMRAAKRA